jgi:hypothetical protein
MNKNADFDTNGFININDFIDDVTLSTVSLYLEYKIHRGELVRQDDPGEGITQYNFYADPLIEVLLLKCKEAVELATGKELLPTYSQVHVYQPDDRLQFHSKREAREISVVVQVAMKGHTTEVFLQNKKNEDACFLMKAGDAIVYKGCDIKQWVKPLINNQLSVQFMLHYVDKNGPYRDYVNDTRPQLGSSSKQKRI